MKGDHLFYKDRLVLRKGSKHIAMILEEYHSGMMGGHSGVLKTTKRTPRLFHWPNLKKDVQKFVAECNVCQTDKTSTLSTAGLLSLFRYRIRCRRNYLWILLEGYLNLMEWMQFV